MHSSSHVSGQSAADLHQTVLDAHHLTASQYTRNQLAYDAVESPPVVAVVRLNQEIDSKIDPKHSARIVCSLPNPEP